MATILSDATYMRETSNTIHNEYKTSEIYQTWEDDMKSKDGYKNMGDIHKLNPEALESYNTNRIMVNELNEQLHKKMLDDANKLPEQNVEEQGENSQMSANRLNNVYAEEDRTDALAEKILAIKKSKTAQSDIQNFFADSSVFVTGGTGFLGKVLIEKLLRSCPGIDTIYILVRAKKGKDASSRIHEMMEHIIFQRVISENPKCIDKLVPLHGNMLEPGLGLRESDRKLITQRVSIIIHAAATVRFDEQLSVAGAINVEGTRNMLQLARECYKLKAFTHVSTAYSNCTREHIEEKFYDPPIDGDSLKAMLLINDQILQDITPKLLGDFPNTYSFTKAIAESVIQKYGAGLPICIVRPSIVISTYEEPIRGWTDNPYSTAGVGAGIVTGVLRTMLVDENKVADIVPVDYTVNAVISATFDTARTYRDNQTSDIPIYNFVSGAQNPITWKKFFDLAEMNGLNTPTIHAVWYYGFIMTNNKMLYLVYNLFMQYIPALMADILLFILGKERIILGVYRKLRKLGEVISYFSLREWRFEDNNCRRLWRRMDRADCEVFPFDVSQMSWEYHFEKFVLGIRVYLLKDEVSTLPEARKKLQRLYYAHQLLKAIFVVSLLYIVYFLSKYFF